MTESHDIDLVPGPDALEILLDEIRLYLEVVEAFRSEGVEPRWRYEGATTEVLR